VTATGTAPLSYQWYLGPSPTTTAPIAGATASTYTTPALRTTTNYWVRVANSSANVDSTTATITVIWPVVQLTVRFWANPWCAPVTLWGPSAFSCTASSPAVFTCSRDYTRGTNVQLTTTAASQMVYTGCDTTQGLTCNVQMNADRTVTAEYRGGSCGFSPLVAVTPPASGPPGTTFTITGMGFTPNWTAVVSWGPSSGVYSTSANVQTDSNGRFSTVIRGLTVGTWYVRARDTNTNELSRNELTVTIQ
jgi:hypothetical protein